MGIGQKLTQMASSLVSRQPTAHQFASLPSGMRNEQAIFRLVDFFNTIPDPDNVLTKAGLRRSDLRKLTYDDEISQCLDTRRDAVLGVPWRLEPNTTRISKYLTSMLAPHTEALITGAFNAVPFGYSVIEVIYGKDAQGRIVPVRVAEKPFEWFAPRVDGGLMYQSSLEGPIEVDLRKFLLTVRSGSYRNPYGEALLSRLYWPVFFRSQAWQNWNVFIERFATPMIVGNTQGDAEKLAGEIMAQARGAVIVTDEGTKLALAETVKDGVQFKLIEEALLSRIQKLILGQTLTSQMGSSGGSYAAAKVHNEVRTDKRNADIRMVSATIQGLVNTLCELNGWGEPPQFVMADDTGLEMERAQRDAIVAEKLGWKPTLDYMMDRYDYNEGDIEKPEIPPARANPQDKTVPLNDDESGDGQEAKMALAFSPQQFTANQQVIEDGIAALLDSIPEPIDPDDLRMAIMAAQDEADLDRRLAMLVSKANPKFGQMLAQATYAAQLIGYVHAKEEA